jgi:hypothetical protein
MRDRAYIEDIDFRLIPDVQAAKENPNGVAFNIAFLGREIKVKSMDFSNIDTSDTIPIDMDYIKGEPFSESEELEFGNLLTQLVVECLETKLKEAGLSEEAEQD